VAKPSAVSFVVSFVIVGMMLGLLLGLHDKNDEFLENKDVPGRPHALAAELAQLETDYQNLLAEAQDLEKKLKQIEKGKWEAYEALQDELEKVKFAAGLMPVSGKGVEVIMQNMPEGELDDHLGFDSSLFSIKYEDILKVVNELYAAGAVAISINDQRLIVTSEIRNAGRFIIVNSRRITPPYVIKAVGDPERLESGLKIKGGLVEALREWGIEIIVEPKEEVIVPAYDGGIEIRYAKPVKKEGDA